MHECVGLLVATPIANIATVSFTGNLIPSIITGRPASMVYSIEFVPWLGSKRTNLYLRSVSRFENAVSKMAKNLGVISSVPTHRGTSLQ